ncbi:MAG TPA: YceD family protein, partial [Fibrobacteria bacterium]|nr:YceD family protein [Fibrobacteria bacterium]
MILPLHLLGKDPQTLELSDEGNVSPEWAEAGIRGKVGLRLDVTPLAGDSYLMRGEATGTLDAECSRCLERVPQPFSVNFDVLLEQKSSQGLEWVDDEDQGVEDYQVQVGPDVTEIPFGDVIAEQVLLNYNLHPLPDLDAAGRCALCGRPAPTIGEAGKSAKAEKAEGIDPRWAKL